MRARPLVTAVAFVVASCPLRAQTGMADGVDAFLRGDYARAAAILKPLTEQTWESDHVAEFFMAALYDNGLGVAADPLRACALYIHASSDRTPIGKAAMALIPAQQRSLGREAFETCRWHANFGFNHRFQPVTFALETGHWITFDLKGVTIVHGGVEKRIDVPLVQQHARFLPLQHSELAAASATRRHFIEVFNWLPLAQPRTWKLMWTVFEVVRDELISVTVQQLVTAAGDEPPTEATLDVRALAGLRLNDDGNAEWAVLTGAARQTRVIESEADRRQQHARAQQARERQEAEKRVDWTRVSDLRRSPELAYPAGNADGCGNVFVHGWTADQTEAITIRADRRLLQIATAGSFDLAAEGAGLEVLAHVYAQPIRSWPFCTDVVVLPRPAEEVWRATRGTISIELSPPGIPGRPPFMYRATIRITGAQFVGPSGVHVDQTQPITLTAVVGWMAG